VLCKVNIGEKEKYITEFYNGNIIVMDSVYL